MKPFYCFVTALLCAAVIGTRDASAERLVILHTNDTHSQIDPNNKNLGGILRRKVLVDSVRAAQPNVMLVDAGDAVQGTLYFSLYGGEVEQKMMNALGYDIQILGNHEFDNGMKELAKMYAPVKATKLSTNYDFSGTELDSFFKSYTIKKIGDKKVGFMAINIDPKGMIADKNAAGVKYLDGIEAANATAWHLKHNEKCDVVVALTHIGYGDEHEPGYTDRDIAANSKNIDIIIGGHSHTAINPDKSDSPAWHVANASGDSILVTQTGKGGLYLGEIDMDLDNPRAAKYRLIPVNKRLDDRIDAATAAMLEPYRHGVDSIRSIKIGKAAAEMRPDTELLNFVSDFVLDEGRAIAPNVDLAIVNKGGIRCAMPKGTITKGLIMQMLPFDNKVNVIDISGADLLDALNVMAKRGGDGVSRNVNVVYDPSTGKCTSVTINGKPLDKGKTYRLATIDYLRNGGDYMSSLTNGTEVAVSDRVLYDDLIDYIQSGKYKGKTIKGDAAVRMKAL